MLGSEITVIASTSDGFIGWADEDGNVLSTEASYTFTPDRSIVIRAIYN